MKTEAEIIHEQYRNGRRVEANWWAFLFIISGLCALSNDGYGLVCVLSALMWCTKSDGW